MSMSEWEVIATDSATISTTALALSTAVFTSLTAAQLKAARKIQLTARSGGIMYRQDGTAPTATVGHLLAQNGNVTIEGRKNFVNLKMIREAAANATVTVTLYGATGFN